MKRRMRRSNKVLVVIAAWTVLAILWVAAASAAGSIGTRLNYVPNEYIIRVRAGSSIETVEQIADRLGATVVPWQRAPSDTYLLALGQAAGRRVYGKSPGKPVVWTIEHIQPNFIYWPTAIPDDEHWDRLWGMRQINAPQAWDIEKGSELVTVAVLDTGVAPHPDLVDRLLDGYDFIDDDNDASPVQDPEDPGGPSHGTHVAGTIAAQGDNGIGVVGVCWDGVRILPVRVLGPQGGPTTTVVSGLDFALQEGAQIVNMSLGWLAGYENPVLHAKIRELDALGVIVVASAGNESGTVGAPAAYSECIAVSAIGPTDTLAYYSNFGPEIDIAAPGGDQYYDMPDLPGEPAQIWSTVITWPDDTLTYDYAGWQGTSMACPHVAGAAALLLSAGVPAGEVRGRLLQSARPPRTGGFDRLKYGAGILDVGAALANASVRIVKPAKGSTVGTDPEFKITMRGIQPNSPRVYFDYADDGDGMPDNLSHETPIIDSSNLSLYANPERTEITFRWSQLTGTTLAAGRHYIYVDAVPLLGGDFVFDWGTFVVAEMVIPRGLHLFSLPYVVADRASTAPSDILAGTDFSITNPNRSVLKRYLTSIGAYATYYPGNPSDLVWVNPTIGTVPTGGGVYDLVMVDQATGTVLDRSKDHFAFSVGAGFWLILAEDTPVTTTQPTLENLVMPGGYVFDASKGCRIPLYQGWNMIGNPYTHSVPLSNALVIYRGEPKDLQGAADAGWVSSNVYGYSTTGVIGYRNIGTRGRLDPYNGYWVRALVGGTDPWDRLFINIRP